MQAYQIKINGELVATAGIQQGVLSAIANWVFIPSKVCKDPAKDWHAGFSLAALDNQSSENLQFFRCQVQVGDEIHIRLVETDDIDEPVRRLA